jgi:hemerythrin-like domain-containing protein
LEQLKTALGMSASEGGIYGILKSEHRQIKASLMEIINSSRIRKDIFSQTVIALEHHMKSEETLFYPRLDRIPNTRMMTLKAIEEHNLIRLVVNDINSAPEDISWLVKLQVLYDVLNRHIDNEENTMFATSKRVISEPESMQLGRDYWTQTVKSMPATTESAVKS